MSSSIFDLISFMKIFVLERSWRYFFKYSLTYLTVAIDENSQIPLQLLIAANNHDCTVYLLTLVYCRRCQLPEATA